MNYRNRAIEDKVRDAARDFKTVLIIEESGVLYPIEIKKNTHEKASAAAAFQVLDRIPEKRRGQGAVVSLCPEPGFLRENVLEIPVWYI